MVITSPQPIDITILASAARTTTQTGADTENIHCSGIILVLDMTNVAAGPSVTLSIDGKDPASGKYFNLLTGAAVTTASTNVYWLFPGAVVTANVSANMVLPKIWRTVVTANNANSGTYSLGAVLVP